MSSNIDEKKVGVGGDESYHVEVVGNSNSIDVATFKAAQQDALSEGSPPWQVITENVKTCAVVVVVQVS